MSKVELLIRERNWHWESALFWMAERRILGEKCKKDEKEFVNPDAEHWLERAENVGRIFYNDSTPQLVDNVIGWAIAERRVAYHANKVAEFNRRLVAG